MILFHEGWPGSGKSYDAVQKVIDNLRRGRKIYSNIEGFDDPKHREALKCMSGLNDYDFANNLIYLKPEEIYNFWTFVEKESLVIIDEAHKFYNSRNWQSKGNNEFSDWCSTARHDGIDLILITQDVGKVDSQVRSLAEWIYRYKKINFMGSLVNQSYLCFAFPDQDSKVYMSKKVHRYNSKVFQCYKSYVTKDIKELKIQTHSNIFKHPIFYLLPVMLIITGYFLAHSGVWHGDLFGVASRTTQHKVVVAAAAKSSLPLPPIPLIAGRGQRETALKVSPAGQVMQKIDDIPIPLEDRFAWVGGTDRLAVLEDRKNRSQKLISDVVPGGVTVSEEIRGSFIKVNSKFDHVQYIFKVGGRLPLAEPGIVVDDKKISGQS